jgi:hypothetical protein
MNLRNIAATLTMVAGLAGCGSQALEDYAGEAPRLDLRDYLSGPLAASGVFIGPGGGADLRFVVEMEGVWEGDVGTLTENFRYADGRTDQRVWTIRFADDQNFTATAPDVEGVAVGAQNGSAARMNYRLRLPEDAGGLTVSMEDWFYLMEDGTLINRAQMRKFGLPVGEVIVAFRKPPE